MPLVKPHRLAVGVLAPYFLLTFLALLVNAAGLMRQVQYSSAATYAFAAAAFPVYALVFLSPAILLTLVARRMLSGGDGGLIHAGRRAALLWAWMIGSTGLLQILVFADKFIYRLYGRHLDGFVWNIVLTPGGLDSLGGGTSTTVSFALICAALVAVQAVLLIAVLRWPTVRRAALAPIRGRRAILAAAVALVAALFAQGAYGVSMIRGYTPILAASQVVPGYYEITFTKFAKRHGFKVNREKAITVSTEAVHLRYPLADLVRHPPEKPYNIVFLVAESLRYDMLTPDIMPDAWAFSERAMRFERHYSGGNGTRMAIFSMFYGLYGGSYWFSFLNERRGPVLVDEWIAQNYDLQLYTSAGFTYPEFDRTAFVRVPGDRLHISPTTPIWRRDEEQVTALLASIDTRPAGRPFMRYMFFESPHANYNFPQAMAIRRPYCPDLNYATMDVEKDIGPMKNRYINACHYLDTQIGRVLEHLRTSGLLDSTVVIVTGDHGEEFMEKGRWGHNSTFSEEQTRPPFVLWVPGRPARVVTAMTSHLDVPSTLLPLMGVSNPPSDYSLGINLLSDVRRTTTVVADWDRLAYVDEGGKVVLPTTAYGLAENLCTDPNDTPITDRARRKAFMAQRQGRLVEVLRELKRFER